MSRRRRAASPASAEGLSPGAPPAASETPGSAESVTRPKRVRVGDLTYDEICIELASLTSEPRRLHASEERRRVVLLGELGRRDNERVAAVAAADSFDELRELRLMWAAREHP